MLARYSRIILMWWCILLVPDVLAASEVLRYPPPASVHDKRSDYLLAVLQLALDETDVGAGTEVTLQPFPEAMNKARAIKLLNNGSLDVMWMTSNREREQTLRPIRICLYKGLAGWRLALIRRDRLAEFAAINDLAALRRLSVGQQEDWADVPVLRRAGFRVITVPKYDQLFSMLQKPRFDWFSRNVLEIWDEEQSYGRHQLVIEPHLLLRYPMAYYFFVRKGNEALAQRIEQGLLRAIADGRFDRLFNSYFGAALQRAQLDQRRLLTLPNSDLPVEPPLYRPEFWISPSDAEPAAN